MSIVFKDDVIPKKDYLSYQLIGYNILISDMVKSINNNEQLAEQLQLARSGNSTSKALIRDHVLNFLIKRDSISTSYTRDEFNIMTDEILSEITGYGVLDSLYFEIPKQDIFVNAYFDIQYQDKDNNICNTDLRFKDEEHFEQFLKRMLDSVNERIDVIHPSVDATLADGTRISATHKCVTGYHTAVFRFHPKTIYTFDEYVNLGVMDNRIKRFFEIAMDLDLVAMLYGSTGSGKTSLLGGFMDYVYKRGRRFGLISDTEEHFFKQKYPDANMVSFVSRDKGQSVFPLSDCVKKTLRYRFDLIFFNELRDSSIFTYLDAMTAGHSGASGAHGDDIESMINRIITMLKEYNSTFTDEFCASKLGAAVNYFVEMSEYKNTKKVRNIYLLDGFEGTKPILTHLFHYDISTDQFVFYKNHNKKLLEALKRKNMDLETFYSLIEEEGEGSN